ncbi:hypothetical protein UCDDA912_g01275 [Diaporthe ampelina]|uniref:Roadblock/LAMTOR2 domain-containing protein n=1 Tax=Diaporthe ampelina TaxID=1214573 RepID=A0A0G2IFD2_9PEZI|nr:hypothetical protein UCDDA912_g01275 [Diaporthe ampelina]
MADVNTSNGADALEETLSRLSKKPGVKATIALDRASGTILKTAGQISSLRTSSSQQQQQQDPQSSTAAAAASSLSASTSDMPASSGSAVAAGTSSETQGAEELASMDELKLLRVRTKKQELVIVPDAKYLLIVIHETPTA